MFGLLRYGILSRDRMSTLILNAYDSIETVKTRAVTRRYNNSFQVKDRDHRRGLILRITVISVLPSTEFTSLAMPWLSTQDRGNINECKQPAQRANNHR